MSANPISVANYPGVKISALPPATALDGTEPVPIVQDETTKITTTGDIAGLSSTVAPVWPKSSVALAAGATNDWAPTLTDIVRLEVTAAGAATVTGLAGGSDGKVIIVTNVGANDVTLMNQDAGSSAGNRFASNGDTLLMSGWSAQFVYSAALSRWTRVGLA